MLDDMHELRKSLERYRAAVTPLGLDMPAPDARTEAPAVHLVRRMFGVEEIPEQLLWLYSIGWGAERWFPNGVFLMDWPGEDQTEEYLHYAALAIGVPFPWRQQLPILFTDDVVLTFVLAEGHVGEIWHYEWDPDSTSPVRAATSLAALFEQWAKAVELGAVVNDEPGELRIVGEGTDEDIFEQVAARGLDPVAFPQWMGGCTRLREWQTACGIDLDEIDREFEARGEMADAAIAIIAELRR